MQGSGAKETVLVLLPPAVHEFTYYQVETLALLCFALICLELSQLQLSCLSSSVGTVSRLKLREARVRSLIFSDGTMIDI